MSSKNYDLRSLTEVGILLAVIVIVMFITGYIPILNIIGTIVLPSVYTILYLRHDKKIVLLALVASVFLITGILGVFSAISAVITCAPVGIALGYCIKNEKSVYRTLIVTIIISAISCILNSMIFLLFIEKTTLINFINNYVSLIKEQIEYSEKLYIQLGVPSEKLSQFNEIKNMINTKVIIYSLPAALLFFSMIASYVNYIFTSSILTKLKMKIKPIVPFSRIYVTNLVGAFLIAMICIGIIAKTKGIDIGEGIYFSFLGIANLMFIINGMAAVTYYLRVKRKLSKVIVFLILFFGLLFQLNIVFIYIGFIDMFFNMRRLDPYSLFKKKMGA
ncbi:hypothetical protein CLTEP_19450 [Clostridium tepidiprofundi DSM 19306]|uniref:DUF2232 domain-containing protein n=1 Tax=Clostridium tepidiprofundi DSM 19306 TaxID=1121338 RepID=A0A151B2T7_9CLOT|nr:DUF2232 domain-containing protein [Clostridium tepidiprofundi]KYH34100.1 hypothetical protein CLTEP_19450 [Clostridium tepidiprofundi DSM 19306]